MAYAGGAEERGMTRSIMATLGALAFTLLVGQITDKTTGQPLRGVRVEIRERRATLHANTGSDGRFRLAGVTPGTHVLHYSSDDVPPQTLSIVVKGAKQQLRITACSTTLDYSCGSGGGS